jgi:hypothetical protein
VAGIVWLVYLALEPYVRRLWPDVLISWTRLLSGRFRDSLVGRDVLFGFVTGAALGAVILASELAPAWLDRPPSRPTALSARALMGPRHAASYVFDTLWNSFATPIVILFILLLLRVLLRRQWLALGGALLLFGGIAVLQNSGSPEVWPLAILVWVALIAVLIRLGLLALASAVVFLNISSGLALTTELSAWYAATAWTGLLALLALAGYAFHLSLAGRSLFSDELLQR